MANLSLLQQFKLLCLGNILKEPSFLKVDKKLKKDATYVPAFYKQPNVFKSYAFSEPEFIFNDLLDKCLESDFYNTLCLAVDLRLKYNLVYTANAIVVCASRCRIRKDLTSRFKGIFNYFNDFILVTLKDLIKQVEYFKKINGGLQNMPSILKRSWAKKLATFSLQELYSCKKYRIGTKKLIKLTHAKGQYITEFMQGKKPQGFTIGDLDTKANFKTIFYSGKLDHKLLLDNVVEVFSYYNEQDFCLDYLNKIDKTFSSANFSPIDYVKYIDKIDEAENLNFKKLILKYVNNCFYRSITKQKKIKQKTLCIIDGSYDARYTPSSNVGVATGSFGKYNNFYLNCLYGLLTCKRFTDSDICFFSDGYKKEDSTLIVDPIPFAEYHLHHDNFTGMCSYGIYPALMEIILNKEHYDNIYIFSNRQAMLGSLTVPSSETEFKNSGFAIKNTVAGHDYYKVDVAGLINTYRFKVNKNVNVISVKSCSKKRYSLPEVAYRCSILNGLSGKEIEYSIAINEFWDNVDKG